VLLLFARIVFGALQLTAVNEALRANMLDVEPRSG
jgi:hypothetical protein